MVAMEKGQGMAPRRYYLCRVCGTTRSKRSLMDTHMQQNHPQDPADFCIVGKDERRYECSVCGTSRSTLSMLRNHMHVHASSQCVDSSGSRQHVPPAPTETKKRKRFDCEKCGLQVKKSAHLQQHLLVHSDERIFICPRDGCEKCYKRQDHLNRHLLRHEKIAHLCPRPGCIMVCSNKSNLQRHLRKHDLKGDLQRGRLETGRTLKCPEPDCQQTFGYPCRVQSHHAIAHGFHYAEIICGEPGCGERFQEVSTLLEHIRSFHNMVDCQFCGASLLRRSFKRHLMVHEASRTKQRLPCLFEGCLCSFANSSNLAVHIRVHHMGRRDYQCSFEECSRTFGYRHTRDNHENTSLHCHTEGDFLEEDLKFQSRPRGGRKIVTLKKVEDLFRKRVIGPEQAEKSCSKGL